MGCSPSKKTKYTNDYVEQIIYQNNLLTGDLKTVNLQLNETKAIRDSLLKNNSELKAKYDGELKKLKEEFSQSKENNDKDADKLKQLNKIYAALLDIIAVYVLMQDIDDMLKTGQNLDYKCIEEEIQKLIFKFDAIEHKDNPDLKKYRKNGVVYAKKVSKYVEAIISQQENDYTTFNGDERYLSTNCLNNESNADVKLDQALDESITKICPKLEPIRSRLIKFSGKSVADDEYKMIEGGLLECLLDLDRQKATDLSAKEQKRAAIKTTKYYLSELDKTIERNAMYSITNNIM